MSYGQLMGILWRRKLIAVLLAAMVVVGAYTFLSGQPAEYRSTATVALLPNGGDLQAAPYYGDIAKSLVPPYAELLKSRTFLDGVGRGLPSPRSGKDLQRDVFVEAVPNAGILRVTGRAGRPDEAARVAAATITAFGQAVADNGLVVIRVIDEAHVPDHSVAPSGRLVLAASLMLGLFVGGAGAVGWERLFGRIRDPYGLAEASALPVLGVVPRQRSLRTAPRIVAGELAMTEFEESLRVLGTNLMFEMEKAKVRSIAITSLDAQAGKSLLAANLAVVVGELGLRVLLVDAHVRHPSQHELFGLTNETGLSSLAPDGTAAQVLAGDTAYPGVRVLVAGPPLPSRKQEMDLYLQRVPRLVELADVVLVDAPPLRANADVRLLVSSVGAVILAVRAGSTSPAGLRIALDGLRLLDTRVLGTVLNWGALPASGSAFPRPSANGSERRTRGGLAAGQAGPEDHQLRDESRQGWASWASEGTEPEVNPSGPEARGDGGFSR